MSYYEVETKYMWSSQGAILDSPLPVWSNIIPSSFIGRLDVKNIGVAVESLFLSCVQAETFVCVNFRSYLEAVILKFPLPVWLYIYFILFDIHDTFKYELYRLQIASDIAATTFQLLPLLIHLPNIFIAGV